MITAPKIVAEIGCCHKRLGIAADMSAIANSIKYKSTEILPIEVKTTAVVFNRNAF